ncbi:MAG: hypothetical protein LCH86_11535 [Proteobacteria bacterium]|nr:hypothetical protein [Pseudomonadota bacterium]
MLDWLSGSSWHFPRFVERVEAWDIYLLWTQAILITLYLNFPAIKNIAGIRYRIKYESRSLNVKNKNIELYGEAADIFAKLVANLICLATAYILALLLWFGI